VRVLIACGLAAVALVCLTSRVDAQPWVGIVNATRAVDWSTAGVSGGIPTRTTVCTTIAAYSGTAATINSALATCPSGQVVALGAGTFTLSTGITSSGVHNVTLRGAGAASTKLAFTGAVACVDLSANVCLRGSTDSWEQNPTLNGGPVHVWTANYTQGSTVLTFDSVSGWAVDQLLILDQFNDTADTGGVFVGDRTGTDIIESVGPGRLCPNVNDPGCGATTGKRTQQEFKRITNISGTDVTITPGLYMPNWRTGQEPQAWSPGVIGGTVGTGLGVEDLTIDATNDGLTSGSIIHIHSCDGCWVKGVRTIQGKRNHVWIYQSARVTVRDSYFYGVKSGGGSQSYAVETFMSSDVLMENNICHALSTCYIGGNTYGSVVAYNYGINNVYSVPGYQIGFFYPNHDVTGMNLFEGNQSNQFLADNFHGTSNLATLFRNHMSGQDTPTKTNALWVINFYVYQRIANFIGNIFGTAGQHTCYEWASGDPNPCIYVLGTTGQQAPGPDALVASTMVRWGNYDTVTAATRWNCAEVDPAGAVTFSSANSCPGPDGVASVLPASFYLSAKPTWWPAAIAYPPIGPDVTGGNVSGWAGHVNKIPARACYESMAVDPSYGSTVLLFNASTCYTPQPGGSRPTGPATRLRILGR
jgi:hypothetical protein